MLTHQSYAERLIHWWYRLILIWSLCAVQVALALPAEDSQNLPVQAGNDTSQGLFCLPFGVCEPCPEEAVS